MEHSTASASRILHPQLKGRYLWKRAQRMPNDAQSHSRNHRAWTCTPHEWNWGGNLEGKNVINQNETFAGISCGVDSEFLLKDRSGWHVFPHSKLQLATELASWLNHFCITGTTSGDICPPFPALALASRLIKQTCQLGSSNCWIHFSPDHTNLFDFAVKQRRSAPLFPHRWQFRDASWLTDQPVAGFSSRVLVQKRECKCPLPGCPSSSWASYFFTGRFAWKWQHGYTMQYRHNLR